MLPVFSSPVQSVKFFFFFAVKIISHNLFSFLTFLVSRYTPPPIGCSSWGSLSLCRIKILKRESLKTPYGLVFSPFEYFNRRYTSLPFPCAQRRWNCIKIACRSLSRRLVQAHILHSIRSLRWAYRPCRATLDPFLIVAETSTEIFGGKNRVLFWLSLWVCTSDMSNYGWI